MFHLMKTSSRFFAQTEFQIELMMREVNFLGAETADQQVRSRWRQGSYLLNCDCLKQTAATERRNFGGIRIYLAM